MSPEALSVREAWLQRPRINGSCQIVPSSFLQLHSKDHVGQRLLNLLSCGWGGLGGW